MGAVAGVIGGILGATGGMVGGQTSAMLGETQGTWKEYEAKIATQNSEYAAAMHMRNAKKMVGRQRAAYAASGVVVDIGSPLDVIDETNRIAEAERFNIITEGERQSAALRGEAALLSMGAQAAITGSTISGASSAFSSFASLGGISSVSTGSPTTAAPSYATMADAMPDTYLD